MKRSPKISTYVDDGGDVETLMEDEVSKIVGRVTTRRQNVTRGNASNGEALSKH